MSKVRKCDICEDTFEQDYIYRGYRKSTRVLCGQGSAKVTRSFRRRLMRWLVGAPIVLKVFGDSKHAWNRKDICHSCMSRIKREVQGDE